MFIKSAYIFYYAFVHVKIRGNMIKATTKLLCLLGHPIAHSFSPLMHNNSLELLNENAVYMAYDVAEGDLEIAIKGLKSLGFVGSNITIPYKEDIIPYLDDNDEVAKTIGAVNTVVLKNDKLVGYNTDVYGFIQSLKLKNMETS